MIEICKALMVDAKVIIMDEPTAALTQSETEVLFEVVNSLRKKGVSIVYISHRMEEIFELCDRITILRDGTYIDTKRIADIDMNDIVKMMIGREIGERYPLRDAKIGDVAFEVKNLNCPGAFENVSFDVRAGEVLGVSKDFDEAIYKAFIATGIDLPKKKNIICTIKDSAKEEFLPIAKKYYQFGYDIYATIGTFTYLIEHGVPAHLVNRIADKKNTIFDLMLTDTVDLIIDIPTRNNNLKDGFMIRRFAVEAGIPIYTSLDTAQALINCLEKRHQGDTSLIDITKI